MEFKNIYTSVACNRTTEAADWGRNGLIAFGASNAVVLLDPRYDGNSAKIVHTYVQHKKRVNTVQWLRPAGGGAESLLLSGSTDGLALLWQLDDLQAATHFPLEGHTSAVNAVTGVQRPNNEWLLATAAADSTLKLWRFDGETCRCVQTLLLNDGFCFAIRLVVLPKTDQVLLAFSSDDESVSLWAQTTDAADKSDLSMFEPKHKLKGHQDWVRGLDFAIEGEDLLLASCAQDNFIRLWRISPRTEEERRRNCVRPSQRPLGADTEELRVEEKILLLGDGAWFAVTLESVLYGHEGWVYGVQWHHSPEQGLRLLSASIDKTLIVWAASKEDGGVWMETVRVGEVGGNSLGFFGGKFASDGKSIMGHSYQGGFHIWNQSAACDSLWTPSVIVGGHFDEVRDLAWSPDGEFLMTVSADQTTRIHAPWRRPNEAAQTATWHELARPQVHGYDMQALAILSRYKFASGAEEKIVRTFQATGNFIENFRHLVGVDADAEGNALLDSLPKGASVPSLGLSNKAVFEVEDPAAEEHHVKDEYPENYFVPVTLEMPPQEETLMQNTLWPEVQKLYGHGFEIYALAATRDGALLASTCRATNGEHAQIILWDTASWKQLQKLPSHNLTVTQMAFSPDGRFLLSVSRDRRWSLFERQDDAQTPRFALVAATDKSNGVHTRIIWSCDWSHDGRHFATSSREGKVVLWTRDEAATTPPKSLNGWQSLAVLELKNESITAVAFAPRQLSDGAYLLALGMESGLIKIYKYNCEWSLLLTLDKDQSHHLTVRRLQFSPSSDAPLNLFQLASCGDDHLVKIYELCF